MHKQCFNEDSLVLAHIFLDNYNFLHNTYHHPVPTGNFGKLSLRISKLHSTLLERFSEQLACCVLPLSQQARFGHLKPRATWFSSDVLTPASFLTKADPPKTAAAFNEWNCCFAYLRLLKKKLQNVPTSTSNEARSSLWI